MQYHVSDNIYNQIHKFVNDRMGLFFSYNRKNDLLRGLNNAMETFGYKNLDTCIMQLLSVEWTQQQIETLASYLTVGESYFYRHKEQIDYLFNVLLKEKIVKRDLSLKIWSAGCCSGEEPYTIAMLLKENVYDIEKWDYKIYGTDINPVFLNKARTGIFTDSSFRKFPEHLKNKYFNKLAKNKYEIHDVIKNMVKFSYLNLASNTYPSETNNTLNLDVILCRNVFIYFEQDNIDKVVGRFKNCLAENGLFIVSPAETFMVSTSIMHKSPFTNPIIFKKPPSFVLRELDTEKASNKVELPKSETPDKGQKVKKINDNKVDNTNLQADINKQRIRTIPASIKETFTTFFEQGKYSNAMEILNSIKIEELDVSEQKLVLATMCKIHANTGDLKESLSLCESLIEKDKIDPDSYFLCATILQELGRVQDAITELNKVLYLDHSYILAHFLLGNIYRTMEQNNVANKHLINAATFLKRLPDDHILEKSEGLTVGRLIEFIKTILRGEGVEI